MRAALAAERAAVESERARVGEMRVGAQGDLAAARAKEDRIRTLEAARWVCVGGVVVGEWLLVGRDGLMATGKRWVYGSRCGGWMDGSGWIAADWWVNEW